MKKINTWLDIQRCIREAQEAVSVSSGYEIVEEKVIDTLIHRVRV